MGFKKCRANWGSLVTTANPKKTPTSSSTTSDDTPRRVVLPLAFQAALLVIVVITINTGLLIFRISGRVDRELLHQIELRGQDLVHHIADISTLPLPSGNLQVVEETARQVALGDSSFIRSIQIVTLIELYNAPNRSRNEAIPVGTIVGHSNSKKLGEKYSPPEALAPEDSAKGMAVITLPDGSKILWLREYIDAMYNSNKPEIVGLVEITLDLAVIEPAVRHTQREIIAYGVLSVIIGAAGLILLFHIILRPIRRLAAAMSKVKRGEFDHQIVTHDPSEVGLLTEAFNDMAAELEILQQHLVAQELIKRELDIARSIQKSLLPETLPFIKSLDLAAKYEAAQEVGGDYYDVLKVDDNRWAMVIGDVSGKGIPASLVMSMTRSIIRSQIRGGHYTPAEVLIRTNNVLCEDMAPGMFVTLTLAYYDVTTDEFTIASAGHLPPIINRDGKIHELRLPGLPLGADNSGVFEEVIEEGILTLMPDDIVLLYTDGITEAMNSNGELFGFDRLEQALRSYPYGPMKNFTVTLMRRISDFRGRAAPSDDLTFIAVKRIAE